MGKLEVRIADDWFVLESDELGKVELKEMQPDEPDMREIAGIYRRHIAVLGWDEFERRIVQSLELELVSEEGGKRVYKGADGELIVSFGQADTEKPDQALRIGQTDVCQGCSQPIYYVGPYWKHAGGLFAQPLHIAVPKTNYKDKSN